MSLNITIHICFPQNSIEKRSELKDKSQLSEFLVQEFTPYNYDFLSQLFFFFSEFKSHDCYRNSDNFSWKTVEMCEFTSHNSKFSQNSVYISQF